MGDVNEIVLVLNEKMMMLRDVGIEICLRSVNGDLAQQPCVREQMERVVNSGKRDRDFRLDRFFVEHLGGEVAVPLAKQHPSQRQALLGRAQSCFTQQSLDIAPAAAGGSGPGLA